MTPRARRFASAAAATLLLTACADRVAAPASREVPVRVSTALGASAVAFLSVEVTGSEIAVPIVVTLAATGTNAQGIVTVPSGPARTFTARGYDVEGTLTHRATKTVDVAPGTGPTVPLVLLPVTDAGAGGAGDDRVALWETDVTLAVAATRRLTASVTHADGTPVPGATIRWATMNAAIATVSPTGLVTAIAPGTTQVVALSGGGAAVATVIVQ